MNSEFRCAGCAFGVLTGILPNGVSEFACSKSGDFTPFFYYDVNPERVADCIDYLSNRAVRHRRPRTIPYDQIGRGTFFEAE